MKADIKLTFIALVVLVQCFNPFAPKLGHLERNDLIITDQTNPEEVLDNFMYAYAFKDSVLYADLLDSGFVFVYFDPNQDPSGRFVSWGRDVDIRTTGRLFRNFDVIDLIWNSTIYTYEDTVLNRSEYSKSFNLTLTQNNETINITGNAIFVFRQCQYDDKWRILQWKDESDL